MTEQTTALDLAVAGKGDIAGVSQKPVMRVDIFDESLVVTRYDGGDRAVAVYEVSPLDLASAFSGLAIATGLLPRECLFFSRTGGGERLGIYVPPSRRTLRVQMRGRDRALDAPLPGLVFCGEGTRYLVFAVKHRPVTEDERLFSAPLPNVHPNGHICAGSVSFPACAVRTVDHALALFLESGFNGDLAGGKSRSHGDDVRELLAGLAKKKAGRFPASDLVSTSWMIGDLAAGEVS
ncbi:MAG: hypothetical protein JXA14_26195 [Anaerolineae bacterium]|nr:hypothetical protein [Anaerolineae bacterium]